MQNTDTSAEAQAHFDRYYRYASIGAGQPGMAGGIVGRRFLTNGHFMLAVGGVTYTRAMADGWRNVTSEDHWSMTLATGFGRRVTSTRLPLMSVVDDGTVDIGGVRVMPKYVELLRELGGSTTVDILVNRPMAFVVMHGLAIVSALPGPPS